MPSQQSCSWCHGINDIRARWCQWCGHAANKPRAECDCKRCMGVLFDPDGLADTPFIVPKNSDPKKEV